MSLILTIGLFICAYYILSLVTYKKSKKAIEEDVYKLQMLVSATYYINTFKFKILRFKAKRLIKKSFNVNSTEDVQNFKLSVNKLMMDFYRISNERKVI